MYELFLFCLILSNLDITMGFIRFGKDTATIPRENLYKPELLNDFRGLRFNRKTTFSIVSRQNI